VKKFLEFGVGFFAVFIRSKNRGGFLSGPESENTQRFGQSLSNMLLTSVIMVSDKFRILSSVHGTRLTKLVTVSHST